MTTVIESPNRITDWVFSGRSDGQSVGFIPTMGAYHRGHRALMEASVRENDITVASLFVNPTQFSADGQAGDYPRNFQEDLTVLEEASVDAVFHPAPSDMYPERDSTEVLVQNRVTQSYEGEIKPRFFPGVATVVTKLLNLIPADRVYFGEKDLQQLVMIRRMIRDLHYRHELRTVPVVRDDDGVAYSSRNRRLGEQGWDTVRSLRELMVSVKTRADSIDRSELARTEEKMSDMGIDLDYVDIVEYPTFDRVDPTDERAILIIAGTVGGVRVKDNLPLHAKSLGGFEGSFDQNTKHVPQ